VMQPLNASTPANANTFRIYVPHPFKITPGTFVDDPTAYGLSLLAMICAPLR
jgi:hypothetical protein